MLPGPSPSQQIKPLEHGLGVQPFYRDRRSAALALAEAAPLLPHARARLERAVNDLASRDRASVGNDADNEDAADEDTYRGGSISCSSAVHAS